MKFETGRGMKRIDSNEEMRGGRKGFAFKLLKSHLLLASIGLVMLLIALAFTLYLRSKIVVLVEEVKPVAQASSEVLTGVQHSLAGLRGWVSLNNEGFLGEWKSAWKNEIKPAVKSLTGRRDALKRYGIEDVLNQLLPQLTELEESQWWVKSVAQTPGNEPARVAYLFEAEPVAVALDAILASTVQEAKMEEELLQEEELIRLLDAQRHFSVARLVLEKIIGEGSFHQENQFRDNLRLARNAVADANIQGTYHSPQQNNLFRLFERESLIFKELADKVIHQRKSDKWNMAQYLMATETVPISDMVIHITTALSSRCVEIMHKESAAAARAGQIAIVIMISLIAVMLFTAFFISRARARGLTEPVSALSTAAQEFAEGRLDHDIPVMTDDELGDLTRTFNAMRGSLAHTREKLRDANLHLEQRVVKRTEELNASRDMTERYLSVSEAMIVGFDASGKTVLINRRGCDVMGYGETEIIGKNWFDNFLPSEQKEEALAVHSKLISGETDQVEYFQNEIITKRGNRRLIFWHNTFLKDEDGTVTGTLSSGQDVTEQREAEEKIRRLNIELERRVTERTAELEKRVSEVEKLNAAVVNILEDLQVSNHTLKITTSRLKYANKELESFSYSVSHDLRAPLRAIDGFARMVVEDYWDKLDDGGKHQLKVIQDSAREMGQLIDDLLAFSRLGRKAMTMSDMDMSQLAEDVFEKLTVADTEQTARLNIHKLPHAYGDPGLIREVFLNLLSNAIKFTKPGETAVIELGGKTEGEEIIYSVKDRGVGFDMAYSDKLFRVFQRLHSAAEFEGTGIGLALVQRIIHRHDGRVWAEAKEGEGATFFFTLPIV